MGWGNDIEQGETLDLLSGLVEKSLVVSEPTEDGGAVPGCLEPVRQYALEKLEESKNAESVRRWHAEYFPALAEEAEPELWGPEDTSAARAPRGRARQLKGGALLDTRAEEAEPARA